MKVDRYQELGIKLMIEEVYTTLSLETRGDGELMMDV